MMPKSIELTIAGTKYPIQKMPLSRSLDFLDAIKGLPEKLAPEIAKSSQVELTVGGILVLLPKLLRSSFDDVIALMHQATDIPEDVLRDKAGFSDLVLMIKAVWEANEFDLIQEDLKKAVGFISRLGREKQTPAKS